MKILNKYALREHLGPLVFALAALTSLLLLNYIAKNIGQLVGKGLPWTVIAEFVGLSIPFTVAMTMPMAVLVAVLYAFSRLAAENEITALKASGVALSRLLTPVLIGAAGISVAMVLFNDQILPRSNHRLRTLMEDIARKKPTFALHARIINEVSPGRLYLQAGHLDDATDRMREVVIYDLGDPTRRRTIYADSGTMALTTGGDLELVLYHGMMQEVQRATPSELQRLYYIVDHVRVRGVGNSLTRSTNDTYKSEREMSICEMQHVVAESQRSDGATRAEIEQSLVNAVRIAATGTSKSPPPPPGIVGGPPFRPPWGLGRAYCDLVASVSSWAAAHVQSPPPSTPSPQAATTVATTTATATATATPATATTATATTTTAATTTAATTTAAAATGALHAAPPGAGVAGAGGAGASGAGAGRTSARVLPQRTAARQAPAPTPTPISTAGGTHVPPSAGLGRVATASSSPSPSPSPSPAQAGAGSSPVPPPSAGVPILPPAPGLTPPKQAATFAPPTHPVPVAPAAAAVTLGALSSAVDAGRARLEDGHRTLSTYNVEIQKKFAIAVACAIFVLLGAPIALRFPRGGVGLVIGVSFAVFGLYYVGLIAGEPLAQAGKITPFWAMWSSNVIFTVIGAVLLSRVGRAGSTARGGDLSELKDAVRGWLARARHPGQAGALPVERLG